MQDNIESAMPPLRPLRGCGLLLLALWPQLGSRHCERAHAFALYGVLTHSRRTILLPPCEMVAGSAPRFRWPVPSTS